MSKYYIVWNGSKTEGFITNSEDDAVYVSSGFNGSGSVSTAGEAFREAYVDGFDDEDDEDGEGMELTLEEVVL